MGLLIIVTSDSVAALFNATLAPRYCYTGEMVKEGRRAVVELGAVSARNPFLPVGKWLHEPEYDALWNLACELDSPSPPMENIANAAFTLSARSRESGVLEYRV